MTWGHFVAAAETYGANKTWVLLKPIPIDLEEEEGGGAASASASAAPAASTAGDSSPSDSEEDVPLGQRPAARGS